MGESHTEAAVRATLEFRCLGSFLEDVIPELSIKNQNKMPENDILIWKEGYRAGKLLTKASRYVETRGEPGKSKLFMQLQSKVQ